MPAPPDHEAPLVRTKLRIPTAGRQPVARPRLTVRLQAGIEAGSRLCLVSAPAGFGKTTLLAQWAAKAELPVAWLALDASDSDPIRFLAGCVAALQTVRPELGASIAAALRSWQRTAWQGATGRLINEIAGRPERLALVLDDYHLIEGQAVHELVALLLAQQPPNLHLIVGSRVDPPIPLARLRSRGLLTELRAADLRFDGAETAAFLRQGVGRPLSDEQVAAVERRTEGWIAGLQMASLSMQRRDDLAGAIAELSGSHRFILDYLTEEVLDGQPADLQRFLLETSILDRMSGPLCDAVTGRDDSQTQLEHLEAANLFVMPLDEARGWYRYHALFADLLRNRLQRTQGERVAELERRASAWHEAQSSIVAAVAYALAAGDLERTARLMEAHSMRMLDRGELATVLGWLEALPEKLLATRPWLAVAQAWAWMQTGRMAAVEQRLRQAEAAPGGQEQRVQGAIAAARTYVCASRGDTAQAREQARRALALLPAGDASLRAFAAALLGSLHRFAGDFAASVEATNEAIATGEAAGDRPMSILARCNLAGTLIVQGELRRAERVLREALASAGDERGGPTLPFAGLAATGLAHVLREWNELAQAERMARAGIEQSEQWGQTESIIHGDVELARVLQAQGRPAEALAAMRAAVNSARDLASFGLIELAAAEAELRLAQNDLAAAAEWAETSGLSAGERPDFQRLPAYLTLARVRHAQGRSAEALQLLDSLATLAETAGARDPLIKVLALRALALQAGGRPDSALKSLERALALGEPERYTRSLLDEGAPMAGLLRLAAERNVERAACQRLLATETAGGPVEPLSERELEVLTLMADGLTNQEIAERLVLALGTVKKHSSNIYAKLGVRGRAQAVLRARELKLG